MELANIEKLLEKYLEATTTIAEEQQLQEYFSQDEVAPHLEEYQAMFRYFSVAKEEQFTKHVPLTPRKKNYLKWISVAAVAVLTVGFYFTLPNNNKAKEWGDLSQSEQEVAQEAFAMLFDNFGKGAEKVGYLETFNEGTQHVNHLEEFKRNTNKFLPNR